MDYFSSFASDSIPSDTGTDIDSNPWSVMNVQISLRAPIESSLMVYKKIGDTHNALFEVPAKRKGQEPILFRRKEYEPLACEISGGGSESPQIFYYGQKSHHMVERVGYDLAKESGLNFGK